MSAMLVGRSGRRCRAWALALAVALSGCSSPIGGSPGGVDRNGLPQGKITQDFLRTRPEAHLQYPGAKVFRTLGADEERNYIEGGSNSAFTGAILITSDSSNMIYDWYRMQLVPRGWKATGIIPGGPTISQGAYQRGDREGFVIGIDDPKLLGNVIGGAIPSGGTILEETYTIDPPK